MTPLRQRMIEDIQVRNLSPHTQASYLQQVSLFARHFHTPPERLGPEEIRAYQVYLTNEKKLAPSSILTAVAALRFLYKVTLKKDWRFAEIIPAPKKPQTLPVVLSPEEVVEFLGGVASRKHRVILTTCYAAGLRISEAVRLTLPAIDSARMVVRVEQGKGQKDRYVMLSPKLLDILRAWWRVERPRHWLFPGDRPGRPIMSLTTGKGGILDKGRSTYPVDSAWPDMLWSAGCDVVPAGPPVVTHLKTWVWGTHRGVSQNHLPHYLNEFVFRFNRRRTPMAAFQSLLGLTGQHGPTTYG